MNRTSRTFLFLLAAASCVLPGLTSCSSGTEPPDDTTPKPYTCTGTPATCLRISSGWTYEGVVLSQGQTGNGGSDPFVLRLDDGRYRLYYAVADTPADPDWWGMVSWVSTDGLNFTKEPDYRFEAYTLFGHWIVRNADGSYRMYWLDQKQGSVNGLGYKAIKSALSTDGGLTFVAEPGERLTYSGTGYETNGIGLGRVILLGDGTYRMYYSGTSDYGRTLSALSSDGLSFTRESGVRLDKLCPAEGGAPMVTLHGELCQFQGGLVRRDDGRRPDSCHRLVALRPRLFQGRDHGHLGPPRGFHRRPDAPGPQGLFHSLWWQQRHHLGNGPLQRHQYIDQIGRPTGAGPHLPDEKPLSRGFLN
jgi:hypothetical protein